jgi:hypothetical protein
MMVFRGGASDRQLGLDKVLRGKPPGLISGDFVRRGRDQKMHRHGPLPSAMRCSMPP